MTYSQFSAYRTLRFIAVASVLMLVVTACSSSSSEDSQGVNGGEVIISQGTLSGTPEEICAAVTPASEPATRQYSGPAEVLEDETDYRAVLCTDAGAIYVDLFEDITPVTVNNFVFLAERGFYNNTTFHRVIDGFMAQAGDPTGTGTGNPGYRFVDEFVGFLHFDRPGLLAMANSGQPTTNGSQFFITRETNQLPTHLNYRHTIFGEVLEGQPVVEAIRVRDPQSASSPGTALEAVVIITEPDAVASPYERPARATSDLVIERIEGAGTALVDWPFLSAIADQVGAFDPSDVTLVDEALQADLNTFLERYQVSVVRTAHENPTCDTTVVPVLGSAYRLFEFENTAQASAALADDLFPSLARAGSSATFSTTQTSEALPHTFYVTETTACSVDAIRVMSYWQRGRFIAVVEALLPASEAEQADLWLDQVVGRRIYENAISDVLRLEIGQP